MALQDGQIRALFDIAAATYDVEIDCDEFLERMARYAEIRLVDAALPVELRVAAAHEQLCQNCREECAALVDILSEEKKPAGPRS